MKPTRGCLGCDDYLIMFGQPFCRLACAYIMAMKSCPIYEGHGRAPEKDQAQQELKV